MNAPLRQRMLIVDDDADVRRGLGRVFARSEFSVIEAPDAECAIRVLRGMEPHVVLSDFQMPGMDGIEFLAQVRLKHRKALRVLLTGARDVRVAAQALNRGAAHRLLLKPWDRLDLLGIIRLAQRCSNEHPTARSLELVR